MPDRSKFFFVNGTEMEKKQFANAFAERYNVDKLSNDEVEEPKQEEMEEEDQPAGVGDDTEETTPGEQVERKKKDVTDGVDDEFDAKDKSYDKYKVNETDTNYEQDEEKKKKEFSKQQQEQKQRDQQKLKDMLK